MPQHTLQATSRPAAKKRPKRAYLGSKNGSTSLGTGLPPEPINWVDGDAPTHSSVDEEQGSSEFEPFISGLSLWGETLFLAAVCVVLYVWTTVVCNIPLPWESQEGYVPTLRGAEWLLITFATPVISVWYLLWRWINTPPKRR